jgi:hypothetical protein
MIANSGHGSDNKVRSCVRSVGTLSILHISSRYQHYVVIICIVLAKEKIPFEVANDLLEMVTICVEPRPETPVLTPRFK